MFYGMEILIIFQVMVGLIFFPIASFRAHQFLLRRERWQKALHQESARTAMRTPVVESRRTSAGCCDCDTDSDTDRASDRD